MRILILRSWSRSLRPFTNVGRFCLRGIPFDGWIKAVHFLYFLLPFMVLVLYSGGDLSSVKGCRGSSRLAWFLLVLRELGHVCSLCVGVEMGGSIQDDRLKPEASFMSQEPAPQPALLVVLKKKQPPPCHKEYHDIYKPTEVVQRVDAQRGCGVHVGWVPELDPPDHTQRYHEYAVHERISCARARQQCRMRLAWREKNTQEEVRESMPVLVHLPILALAPVLKPEEERNIRQERH
jgi:hypothetical protein